MSGKRKRPYAYQTCGGGIGPPPEKSRKILQHQPPRSSTPDLPDLRSFIEKQKRDKDLRSIIPKRLLGNGESIHTPSDSTPQKQLKREPPPHIQHPRVHSKGTSKNPRQRKPIQKQTEPIAKPPHVHMHVYCRSAPQMLHKLAAGNIIGHQLDYMRSDQFFQFINSAEECSDDQKVSLFIKILLKLLEQGKDHIREQVANILHELLRNQTLFLPCLSSIICKMPLESHPTIRINFISFLGNIHLLFWKMLERCPPLLSCIRLPIDTLAGSTRQLADQEIRFQEINEKVQQLVKKRDDIRSEQYQLKVESLKGEDDAALPTPAELRMKTMPLDLSPNKIQGCYSTIQEYLTLQYRLLREDFINPLRTALNKLQDDEDCQEVKVYENVQFNKGETYTQGETAFKVSFVVPDQRLVNWEYSKRFMYGSLLCLSHDNFQTVIFATVAERDINQLKQGVVTIKVENGHDGLSISPRTVYRMAESAGYYGAYAPVLKHLNNAIAKPEQLPFSNYLIECSCEVHLPAYLRNIKDERLNFTGVLCTCPPQRCIHKNVDILDAQRWSELDVTLLDPSQKKALYTALTNELAMIQGPPGTGKTYIGLKILETLLINQHLHCSASRRPIVVVCYTNHALDQFLEGVIKIRASIQKNVEIRRVGGRCKSEQVKKYNIRHHLQRACRQHGLQVYSINRLKQKIEALDELLDGKYNQLNCHIYAYFFGQQFVWELKDLGDVAIDFLRDHFDTHSTLASWLCPAFDEAVGHHNDRKCLQPFSHHQAVEDDRKITEGEEDDMLFRILGEEFIKKFVFNLKSVAALTDNRAHSLCTTYQGVDELKESSHMRLQLFKYWFEKVKPKLENAFAMTKLERERFEKEREMIMIKCLKDADVVGLTTTGAAKYHPILSQIGAKIVLIEEAAEVLEAHVLATLTQHTQHLILIGDHKQLRPKTNDYILARDYKMDVSLFERLINNRFPCVTLKVQHRMRPEISEIVSSEIYNGILEDDPTTEQYCDIKGMKHNLYFIDHTESETPNEELQSPANDHEAAFLAHLCQYLLQQGYKPEEITVITPYTGQMFNLRRTFKQLKIENVQITPIDSYQGEENEIILLSLVRSNTAGFVKDDNRVCVALSRAKQGLYCIGNFTRLFQHSSKRWESIVSTLKAKQLISECLPLQCARHKNITEVSSAKDFYMILDGGCTEPCKHRLPCNHVCPSKCHPSEESHNRPCREPCPNYCREGHRCRRLCYKACGDCEELVDKLIPKCKHVQKVPCYQHPTQFICQKRCSKILPCGHPCTNTCGDVCTTECRALVKRTWLCGHEAQAECYKTEQMYARTCQVPCYEILKCEHPCRGKCGKCRQGRLHEPCQENCDRILICGHKCSGKCAKNCPPCNKQCVYSCPHGPCGHDCRKPCQECPHRCEWRCKHLKCTRNCGEPCDRKRCDEPCLKSLSCGHPCLGLCGEPCLSICQECNKEKWEEKVPFIFGTEEEPEARFIQLSDCQHIFEVKGMDRLMDGIDQKETIIQWKCCPLCKQPIITTLRYANIAKQIIKDINKVKYKEWYVLTEEEREVIRTELSKMASSTPLINRSVPILHKYQSDIMTFPDVLLSQEHLVFTAAVVVQEDLDTLLEWLDTDCMEEKTLVTWFEWLDTDMVEKNLKDKTALLKAQIEDFIEWLKLSRKRGILTDQMQQDVRAEQNRISLLTQIYTIQKKVFLNGVRLKPEDRSFLETTLECYEAYGTKLSESTKLTDDMYELKQHNVKILTHRYTQLEGLTEEEKKMVVKAIGAKPGSWYKCPKGHFYHIGECGGAMETGTCPECKAPIGGHRHQLLSDNAHAREFDRSQHAAWSEGANMLNYQL